MRPLPNPRRRIPQLAAEQHVTLAALSEMLGRDASYLQLFCAYGVPARLRDEHVTALASFFGVGRWTSAPIIRAGRTGTRHDA